MAGLEAARLEPVWEGWAVAVKAMATLAAAALVGEGRAVESMARALAQGAVAVLAVSARAEEFLEQALGRQAEAAPLAVEAKVEESPVMRRGRRAV